MTTPGLVDLHAHFLTEEYVAAAVRAGHRAPDGMPGWPSWSVGAQLELMDRHGIERAVLSVSSPGVHFGDDVRARVLARQVNAAAAALVADRPDRFGFLAALPLPDLDGALAEAGHALDQLGASGVVVLTNAAGRYPGDPRLEPLWRELDSREAVVLLHPTSPPNWRDVALDRPRPLMEFVFDGVRAVGDLVLSGVLARYPRIRFVVGDAGAVLPLLASRLELLADDGVRLASQLGSLWVDLGTSGVWPASAAERVVYGSGSCFTPVDAVARQLTRLDAAAADWRAVTTANAARLLERLPVP
ncbi:amidohydrolase family protein [Jiangella mangrovi]|uniref:6-methylsalicylate decarboxylase n=1 Tax=Jiangella mangrovi TaxID=1524084 RepID=A0A7W9LPX0_9ACTN|nr:amidohydrolase family protein [Jiangella mangrovi]MBB5791845.1 putative TIM-barrel fold metal-dependent hydrolase [Jiangella mangrovi]